MVSFAQLLEQLEKNRNATPLMVGDDDESTLTVVRLGKELHDENETSFWDEFISLCGNSEGLSNLLGVSKEKINSWPIKIQEQLNKLEKQKPNEKPPEKDEKEVVPTGDSGAFVSNQDPNIGEIS